MSPPQHRFASGGRRPAAVTGLALAAATLVACNATTPVKTTTPTSLPPRATRFIGQDVTTAHGNHVDVERYVASVKSVAASSGDVVSAIKVRTCAAPTATEPVSVRRDVFYLLLHSGLLRAVAKETIRSPLIDQSLAAGNCTEGWISYQRPAGSPAIGVVLSGSTVVLWTIRSGASSSSSVSTTTSGGSATSSAS